MFLLPILIIFLSNTNYLHGEAKNDAAVKGFTVDLIHRSSLNNQNAASKRQPNINRFSNLTSPQPNNNRFETTILSSITEIADDTDIIPNGGNYLMRIFIGTPPVETLAIADTGSDLIWVQCKPCPSNLCYHQNAPLFDPQTSSSYTPVTCDSQFCRVLPLYGCDNSNSKRCVYRYSYVDKSYTNGELASESISFGGQTTSFPKSVFGCGHNNNGKFKSTGAGLVGLGNGPLSLVSQLGDKIGKKFSYCLPPSQLQSTTKLRFGEEATISGNGVVSTPLVPGRNQAYYTVNLQGITIGGKTATTSDGKIVIDSGTTLTYVSRSFYSELESLMKEAIGGGEASIVSNPPQPFNLCYSSYQSIKQLPQFVVHFQGADVSLNPHNFLIIANNLLCFAVLPQDGVSIYGNI